MKTSNQIWETIFFIVLVFFISASKNGYVVGFGCTMTVIGLIMAYSGYLERSKITIEENYHRLIRSLWWIVVLIGVWILR